MCFAALLNAVDDHILGRRVARQIQPSMETVELNTILGFKYPITLRI